MIKAGIRVVAPLLLLLLSVSDAHALYSYSEVTSTLNELSASAVSPDGARLQVVRIGTTVKGRPILMAVLSATPITPPPPAADDEATAPDPAAQAPAAGAGGEEGDTEESAPQSAAPAATVASPAAAAAGESVTAPAGDSLVLTLEPEGKEVPPIIAAPAPEAGSAPDTLELQSQDPKDQEQPRRVMIICRQHGNEPASTEAAMQFLKEYTASEDPRQAEILRQVTFLVVPMLNGDGAEKYQRRNARNVDLNRDWLAQSQPETRAIVRTVAAWHPDLVMDLHELATSDWTPSFVEAMEQEAGATSAVGDACNAAIAAVVGPLRAQEMRINARPVFNYREPRLAHRYFAVKRAVPSILVETRRAGSVPLETRAAVHHAAILAAARYMAGEKLDTPSRVIAEWVEPGAASSYRQMQARRGETDPAAAAALAERRAMQLASRASRASVARKRAELAAKLKAAKAKKRR